VYIFVYRFQVSVVMSGIPTRANRHHHCMCCMLKWISVRWLTPQYVVHVACNKQYTAEIGASTLTYCCGTIVLAVSVSPVAAVQAKLVG
jgi:hypothetical protein